MVCLKKKSADKSRSQILNVTSAIHNRNQEQLRLFIPLQNAVGPSNAGGRILEFHIRAPLRILLFLRIAHPRALRLLAASYPMAE